ncbi:unnamed protein product [Rangifer tarandus platyrhynchus]|uniref:Uncharacterized protein n=1 Tax=Rangifer tarandus platyrhynchus TaxID=3082113 RepID=A0AC59YNG9_RANTA
MKWKGNRSEEPFFEDTWIPESREPTFGVVRSRLRVPARAAGELSQVQAPRSQDPEVKGPWVSERAPPRLAAGVADSALRSCKMRMRLLGFARSLGKGCVFFQAELRSARGARSSCRQAAPASVPKSPPVAVTLWHRHPPVPSSPAFTLGPVPAVFEIKNSLRSLTTTIPPPPPVGTREAPRQLCALPCGVAPLASAP